jgi:hypothetical protein
MDFPSLLGTGEACIVTADALGTFFVMFLQIRLREPSVRVRRL